jgi:hypothetical protein
MSNSPDEDSAFFCREWLNGHRKRVMKEISAMSSMRAACVVAIMVTEMQGWEDKRRLDFIDMMRKRLK